MKSEDPVVMFFYSLAISSLWVQIFSSNVLDLFSLIINIINAIDTKEVRPL